MSSAPVSPPPRRWPVLAVLVFAGVACAWIWLASGLIRQLQMMASYAALLVSGLLLLIWLLFFSRLRLRARLLPVAALAAAGPET